MFAKLYDSGISESGMSFAFLYFYPHSLTFLSASLKLAVFSPNIFVFVLVFNLLFS